MAISTRSFCIAIFLQLLLSRISYANECKYTSIISFGDSLADTGNLKNLVTIRQSEPRHFMFPPYGETFFHKPTGRCSNGRLIIDFIDCQHLFEHSLFLMGEIGGNDYNDELHAGKSIKQVRSFVPLVIKTIIGAVKEVIKYGAKTIIVPGNLPIGCSSSYLEMYNNPNAKMYDNTTGCLIWLNKFAEYHNQLLQRELHKIRKLYDHVNIVSADYYNAAMQVYRSPKDFGFTNGGLKACCGGGGPYNFNQSVECGDPSSTSCADPDTYFSWDGVHLTEAAYRLIYTSLFHGSYTIPRFSSLCINITT